MDDSRRQRTFINVAHFTDHYVLLIFPTVVIGLETDLQRSYAELILLATACFVAFGLFSLPWGWAGDHWSRRRLLALFYLGSAVSLAAAAAAPDVYWLAAALFVLGIFAAIFHPIGITLLLSNTRERGRDIALNGVFGNLGVAFAPGATALIAAALGWRAAFAVPAAMCVLLGLAYLAATRESPVKASERTRTAEVSLGFAAAVAIFAAFAVIAFTGGVVFNVLTVAIPKVIDEGIAGAISLTAVGSIATVVLLFGGAAQLAVGRLLSLVAPHLLFAAIGVMQVIGVVWATLAQGPALLVALALSIAAIYAQVTVADVVIARYTADAWRGRVYAVRYFLTFISSGAAIGLIAVLHGQGGFFLVLAATSVCAVAFAAATVAVAMLAGRVEGGLPRAQPAE
jgi:predicted MFS family arabinose efflux permease